MSVEVALLNSLYQWKKQIFEGITCFFKGNLFYNNELLTSEKLIHLISLLNLNFEKCEFQELKAFLNGLNGEYALIIESPHEIIFTVDRVRSIPLFYSIFDGNLIISDDAYYIKKNIKSCLNEENAAEFLVTGYVTGSETLFENICQVQTGEFLVYDKKSHSLQNSFYFKFIPKDLINLTVDELLSKLDSCFVNVFKRLIDSTVNKGKQIVVPLSGGLDSRLIVAFLKRLGVENVICFTYGSSMNDREVKISKQVAGELGYKWLFVKYTHDKWHKAYCSKEMQLYQKYSGNLVSLPLIQDYLALKVLQEDGRIPKNSVFVPGHSGDMLSGSHIPFNYADFSNDYNEEFLLEHSLKNHYILWKWDDSSKLKHIFEQKIQISVSCLKNTDSQSYVNAIELFDFSNRQAKFIVNSVRAYEFFGYEWRIPLWDSELIDFFVNLPVELLVCQNLYIQYVNKKLFQGKLCSLHHIDCTTKLRYNRIRDSIFYRGLKFVYFQVFPKDVFIPISYLNVENMLLVLDDFPLLRFIYIFNNKKILVLPFGNNICTANYLLSVIN